MILLGHMWIVCDMSTVIYSYVLFEFDSCKIRVTPQYSIFCLLDSYKDILAVTVTSCVRLKKGVHSTSQRLARIKNLKFLLKLNFPNFVNWQFT